MLVRAADVVIVAVVIKFFVKLGYNFTMVKFVAMIAHRDLGTLAVRGNGAFGQFESGRSLWGGDDVNFGFRNVVDAVSVVARYRL